MRFGQSGEPLPTRDFSVTDAKRSVIVFGALILTGLAYWFLLPFVRGVFAPTTPGGANGPWVIHPIIAMHVCAVFAMTAVTMPLVLIPFRRMAQKEDEALGTRYDPLASRGAFSKFRFFLAGSVGMLVYSSAFFFYLSSWTLVTNQGIEERFLWVHRKHSFQDIQKLTFIPDGYRSESITRNGPWYEVGLKDDRGIDISLDNEGLTGAELKNIVNHISNKTGMRWNKRHDARPR